MIEPDRPQVSYAEPLVAGAVGAASNITESAAQAALLALARTVLEALAPLAAAARGAGGNPRARAAHAELDAQLALARAAALELARGVRDLGTQHGAVRPLLDSLARSVARLTEHRCETPFDGRTTASRSEFNIFADVPPSHVARWKYRFLRDNKYRLVFLNYRSAV